MNKNESTSSTSSTSSTQHGSNIRGTSGSAALKAVAGYDGDKVGMIVKNLMVDESGTMKLIDFGECKSGLVGLVGLVVGCCSVARVRCVFVSVLLQYR